MKLKSLGVNSHGNCHLLTSAGGRTIMLDCGVKYQNILRGVDDFSKIDLALYTHEHSDHVKALDDLRKSGIKCFGYDNLTVGRTYQIGEWNFMPLPMVHSVDCMGFMIYNVVEKIKIVYITDTCVLPLLKDTPIDIMLIECNYTLSTILQQAEELKFSNSNYNDHTSTEELNEWLSKRQNKPTHLVITHTSNTNLDYLATKCMLMQQTEHLYFAEKGETICLS